MLVRHYSFCMPRFLFRVLQYELDAGHGPVSLLLSVEPIYQGVEWNAF
jgi:hypothetical protein